MKSNLFIISGPSGSGKDTIANMVLAKHPKWQKLVTMTSRGRKKMEDPDSYRFLSKDEFRKMIENGEMFEWAKVHGHYYGNSNEYINSMLGKNMPIIGDVDIQGAKSYKQKLGNRVVLIFLKVESFEVLKRRITKRKRGESPDEIQRRLIRAKEELEHEDEFDQVVINRQNRAEEAAKQVEKIVLNED